MKKTIGKLYAGPGAKYFLRYCPRCKESIYWNSEEVRLFLENSNQYIKIKRHFFRNIKFPKIKVQWVSRAGDLTPVQVVDYNNIIKEDNMAKTKTDRNKELIKKKKEGWSFRQLASHFNIAVSRAYQIWEENEKNKTAFRAVEK